MENLEMFVIYQNTSDYPGRTVARKFTITSKGQIPDDNVIESRLEDLRKRFQSMGLVCLDRHPTDDPVIVETWV